LDQPRRRVGRRALVRPGLQRLDERVLRRFLGQRQMPRAEDPRERRDDVREVVLEVQIVDHGRVTSTSRTSMLPSSMCGQSFAIFTASSYDAASITIRPPITSFPSVNGASVTPSFELFRRMALPTPC